MHAYRIETVRVKENNFPYEAQTAFKDAGSVIAFARSLQDADIEKFLVLYLNVKNKLIGITVQLGSLNAAVVYPREVAKMALLSCAAAIIFVHNHPSDDPYPSQEDKDMTKKLKIALDLFGIQVHDHIILGSEGKYFSFAENLIL